MSSSQPEPETIGLEEFLTARVRVHTEQLEAAVDEVARLRVQLAHRDSTITQLRETLATATAAVDAS